MGGFVRSIAVFLLLFLGLLAICVYAGCTDLMRTRD